MGKITKWKKRKEKRKKEKEKNSQNSEMIGKTCFNFTELSYEEFENKSDFYCSANYQAF